MEQAFSTSISVLIISFVRCLERMGYYGMRALIVLYAIDEFALERSDAYTYFGFFSLGVYLANIPMALLSDFIFKQKNGSLIGLIILVLGYLVLLIPNIYITALALFFISIGLGLVSPNMTVLMGRLFKKQDKKRNLGFIIYLGAVNIGAFLSILVLGYVGETYGYQLGFGLAALCALAGLLIFLLTMNKLNLVENNELRLKTHKEGNVNILDDLPDQMRHNQKPPPLPSRSMERDEVFIKRALVILVIGVFSVFYWQLYEILSFQFFTKFDFTQSLSNFGISLFGLEHTSGVQSFLFFPIAGIFLVLLYFYRNMSSIYLIGIALILMTVPLLLVHFGNADSDASILIITLVSFAIMASTEIIFSAIVLSYLTRLSHVKFSSTIIGLYFTMIMLGGRLFDYLRFGQQEEPNFLPFAVLSLIVGLLFIIGKKVFLQLSEGLD